MPAQPAKKQTPNRKNDGLTVISPTALACYAYVWKARPSLKDGGDPQYSVTLVFPKGTDLTKLRDAAKKAAALKWGAQFPSGLKTPFHNGDKERPDDPLFKGTTYLTARTNQKPGIVDNDVQPILDEMEFYSGCKCRASLYANAYDQKGGKGVSFLLNNIQKLADGTRLSGRKSAEEDFGAADGENAEDFDDDNEDPF